MNSVLDKATREELIKRINSLNDHSARKWGTMNVYQMIKHCVMCDEMFLGKTHYKRVWLGKIFGRIGLKNILKKGFKQGEPTSPDFKIKEVNGNVASEKDKWISLVRQYENFSPDNFVHWFFGKMSKEEIGQFAYLHIDHHLRQFNS
jgi:hypothetical protein